MKDSVFREYDIRGIVDTELSFDGMSDLVHAIVYYLTTLNPALKKIAVGMDGRVHSPKIKEIMCAAIREVGLDVVFFGVCPSPALYFGVHTQDVDAGLMITASHNPATYNGIKIMERKRTVWGTEIQQIKTLFHQKVRLPRAAHEGTLTELAINDLYVSWLANHFPQLHNFTLPIVIDCGNGAAGAVLPQLVDTFNWQNVTLLCSEVNGLYPNHTADPTVEANMLDVKEALADSDAVCGIGLDGDADRVAVMTKHGMLVPGDRLVALFVQQLLKTNLDVVVVVDIKCSEYLITLMKKWGATVVLSPSGHAIVKAAMQKNKAVLAGELSGHMFFADQYFGYDDGIYAMLRFLSLLMASKELLEELLAVMPRTYSTRELRVPYDQNKKEEIFKKFTDYFSSNPAAHLVHIDGVRVVVPYGWAIVRASNTQPVLSIRAESETKDGLLHIASDVQAILNEYINPELLSHELAQ